jgi:hypothetical protein
MTVFVFGERMGLARARCVASRSQKLVRGAAHGRDCAGFDKQNHFGEMGKIGGSS